MIDDPQVWTDLLRGAAKVVDDADLPQDLRGFGFAILVWRLLSQSPPAGQALNAPEVPPNADQLGAIASRIGVKLDDAGRMYDVSKGELRLVVGRNRLSHSKASATRDLALLTAAGRQACGIDDQWTASEILREVCREYGVLDISNFAGDLTKAREALLFRGKGAMREV